MRGRKINPEQIEQIKAVFAETESLTSAAKAAGVSIGTASKYIHSSDEFEEVRKEKRIATISNIADELAEVRQLYLNHLKEPTVIASASAKDSAVIVGITTEKHQLVTGEATERSEHVDATDARDKLVGRVTLLADRRTQRADRDAHRG